MSLSTTSRRKDLQDLPFDEVQIIKNVWRKLLNNNPKKSVNGNLVGSPPPAGSGWIDKARRTLSFGSGDDAAAPNDKKSADDNLVGSPPPAGSGWIGKARRKLSLGPGEDATSPDVKKSADGNLVGSPPPAGSGWIDKARRTLSFGSGDDAAAPKDKKSTDDNLVGSPPSAGNGWIGKARRKLSFGPGEDATSLNPNDPLAGYKWEQFINEISTLLHVDHPDNLVRRYVEAKKYNVDEAYRMIVDTVRFLDNEDFAQIKMGGEQNIIQYPLENGLMYFYGYDKDKNVVGYIDAKVHNPKKHTSEEFTKYILYQMSLGYLVLGERKTTLVFDMEGFTMSNVDYQGLKYMFNVLAHHFPDSLSRIIFCNAPWTFNGVWNVMSGFLHSSIKEKVQFLSGNELNKYIDENQIPASKGGKANFEYKYIPPSKLDPILVINPALKESLLQEREDLLTKFIEETEEWVRGVTNNQERTKLADQLADNYRKLAPYIWSQGYLHRQGVISDFDKIDFSKY